ncbi:MAG: pantoate--beta-alanine ligase [Abditibacteriota bacterium]|nr:pantoate--beta-alanine ligase [Abditibacteriota bacterium]
MEIIQTPQEMQQLSSRWKCEGHSIGFVPTMGALHAGHLALGRRAREENSRFVASLFVNPLQFGVNEDLSKYPRPFEEDCQMLRDAGCDALFAPSAETMYGISTHEASLHVPHTYVEVAMLGEVWEGVVRPGHLRGVATVVAKLFNIVLPQRAYFGEKDFQQLRVIEQMVQDLNFPITIVPVETVREADGLALSSRNAYLSAEERAAAQVLSRALCEGVARARAGESDAAQLGVHMQQILDAKPQIYVQYLTVVDANTLDSLAHLDGRPARILIAARVGQTRLIDNMPL